MNKTTKGLKFTIGVIIMLGAIAWLGKAGYEEGKAYYMTADELMAMGDEAQGRRIMLMGDLVNGTVKHSDGQLNFTLVYNGVTIPVVYEGSTPVPDTFRDGQDIQALVEGRMSPSGQFVGQKIQAKCASKYEADPSKAYGQDKQASTQTY